MQAKTQAQALERLRSAQGHLQAVVSMLEDSQNCESILYQLSAVDAALHAAGRVIVFAQVSQLIDGLRNGLSEVDEQASIERLMQLQHTLLPFAGRFS